MTISISSEQEKIIQDLIRKGRYESFDQVVNEAIQLLGEQEDLLTEIDKGIESGDPIPFDKDTIIQMSDEKWKNEA